MRGQGIRAHDVRILMPGHAASDAHARFASRARRALATLAVMAQLLALPAATQADEGRTLTVPSGDYPTLEAAIAASRAGDLILVAPGTYPGGIVIPEDKGGITIRGVDRNQVVFNGEDRVDNAIEVKADGVTLENMTAHNYVGNGFYWDGVTGFGGRYLTVWNVGLYGIYAIESRNGIIEGSYVSGAADAAFYIGECYPCDTTLRDNAATLSAVGYSGTNAGGNLVVESSIFENNAVGILPNSYDVGLAAPPQREATFRGNVIRGSGSVPTPRQTPLGGFVGIGIGIAGGVGDIVDANEVTGSTRYGIAVFAAVDRATTWVPSANRVTANTVSGSGTADLALAGGAGEGNCFQDNDAATAAPPAIVGTCSAAGSGDQEVAAELVLPPEQLLEGLPEAPSYADTPAPPFQPAMPIELRPAPDAGSALVITVVALLVLVAGFVVVYAARPQNIMDPKDRGNIPMRNAGVTMVVLGATGTALGALLLLAVGR
jgi:parallel beta helix pectate lyase-like protein